MAEQQAVVLAFLQRMHLFQSLSPVKLEELSQLFEPWNFRSGQAILIKEQLPAHFLIIYQGKAQMMGYDPTTKVSMTLQIMQPGDTLGGVSLVRQVPTEVAIAVTDTNCLALPAPHFLRLFTQEPEFAIHWRERCELMEAFDLLGLVMEDVDNLSEIAAVAVYDIKIQYLKPGNNVLHQWAKDYQWFISSGVGLKQFPLGTQIKPAQQTELNLNFDQELRVVGIPSRFMPNRNSSALTKKKFSEKNISEKRFTPLAAPEVSTSVVDPYPYVAGRGQVGAALACFQMLAEYFHLPLRKDAMRRTLEDYRSRRRDLSLQTCGAVAESMGLNPGLVNLPATALDRLPTPALIIWQEQLAIVYAVTAQGIVLGIPETGIRQFSLPDFQRQWGGQVDDRGLFLTLQPSNTTHQARFSLSWFLPAISRYRRVLIEVLIASFFVQLFGLANPLIVQLIVDKVLVQNSIDTLNILGIFLLIVGVFEAVLSSLRTYLFVDTTNRIDVTLGTAIIDHLLRLPLPYFERRPVGELSSRVHELENIRTFLTSTALTVVLDAVFSVIYIFVMLFYSWKLTLVALSTIPLFVALTWITAPIVRRQLRRKAEDNAATQSHLVEIISGIQTVKAQNIELRSRWQWQQYYNRYIVSGFETVKTFTAAGSASTFLNQLSGLLILWAGAYMVLKGSLSVGQLFAFRIIAGYVTSPLLRLTQLWQNFQETALSIERLADILDTPQEAEESNALGRKSQANIPMPVIRGEVKFSNISFSYKQQALANLQLDRVSLSIPAGIFVGIVGQSGSGKSTLMKLLPRLYEPQGGQILIDNYDVMKVELYSLRQQIGIVPQDSLLFDGTIQENITLTNPEATSEEMILAARVAVAHDFIMNLPNGYNTRVGERGAALSGGQRQRIAIARTILQNPRLLILDEATSALDYETERQLSENLALTFQGRTVFFITHRLSTIKNADLIVAMDQGKVVEQGNHQQLMKLKGYYHRLYSQQELVMS